MFLFSPWMVLYFFKYLLGIYNPCLKAIAISKFKS